MMIPNIIIFFAISMYIDIAFIYFKCICISESRINQLNSVKLEKNVAFFNDIKQICKPVTIGPV